MRHLGITGFSKLVGVLVIAALAAGISASGAAAAAPEWFECAEVAGTGTWTNTACSTEDATKKSKYERVGIAPANYSVSIGGEVKLTDGVDSITCTKTETKGEIEPPNKVAKVSTTFIGCKGEEKTTKKTCEVKSLSPEGAKEKIVLKTLKGEIGKVAKAEAASEVGLLLTPESGPFAEIEGTCLSPAKSVLEGGLVGEVAPVGKTAGATEILYKTLESKQKIQLFEGATKTIKSFLGTEVRVEGNSVNSFERAELGAGGQVAARNAFELGWTIKGMNLVNASEQLTIREVKSEGAVVLKGKIGAELFEISCTTLKEVAGSATEIFGAKPGTVVYAWRFTGCTMPAPAKCAIENGTITSMPLEGAISEGVALSADKLLVANYKSNAGSTFLVANAIDETGACPVKGAITVTGTVLTEVVNPGSELFLQEFLFEPVQKFTYVTLHIIGGALTRFASGLAVGTETVTVAGLMTYALVEGGVNQLFSAK